MIGRRLGHYEVVDELGSGGMGIVYRARDLRLHRDVALKVLPATVATNEKSKKRFSREALTLSRLNHPNIATIHDFDSDEGTDFLVMELIDGSSPHVLPNEPLLEAEVARLGIQLGEGLAAAHAQGVLHRDLKPSNLRITTDGRLKILDFGLAQLVAPSVNTATQTAPQENVVEGTLPYMAPEQINGQRLDERTDLYSAGVVLYELATGQKPFEADTAGHLIASILQTPPVAPSAINSRISPGLEQVILKAIEKDPDLRYQSARELAIDLRRLRDGRVSDSMIRGRRSRKLPRFAAAAVAMVVVVAVVLGVHWRGKIFPARQRIASIAVLPLKNLSGDPRQNDWVDGITNEMISQLAEIESLRVTNSPSSMQMKPSAMPLRDIATALGVDHILAGSVLTGADRIRLSFQLLDPRSGRELWSHSYDEKPADLPAREADVARSVASELDVPLTQHDEARLATIHVVNPEAHSAFLRGLNAHSYNDAIAEFTRAVTIDPNFVDAWINLGQAYVNMGWFAQTEPPMVAYPKAKEMALRAMALDPNAAEPHAILAAVKLHHEWDWAGSEREFKTALQLNPSSAGAHHIYAHYLLAMDRLAESVAETRKATELDPLDPVLSTCVGWHCLFARQYDDAIAQCLKLVNQEKAGALTYYYLGRVYARRNDFDRAIPALETAVKKSAGANSMLATLGYVYARAGRRTDAEQILAQLQDRAKSRYVAALDFAVVYAGLHDDERTFDWLEKAYLERSTWLVHIKWDDRFAAVHSDPRFKALLDKMGLPSGDVTNDAPAPVRQIASAQVPVRFSRAERSGPLQSGPYVTSRNVGPALSRPLGTRAERGPLPHELRVPRRWDTEVATDLAYKLVGNLGVPWHR